MIARTALNLAVVGAGPAGLALALHAAHVLPQARVTVFDARAESHDIGADARTLALALGTVQFLQRLQAWPAQGVQPISAVHVSQAPPSFANADVLIRAEEQHVPMLGAVMRYGTLVACLQTAWLAEVARQPQRLSLRLGCAVQQVLPATAGVELDTGTIESFDLAVIAEGGVFAEQSRKALTHDYRQTAWVGSVEREDAAPGMAFERFTRDGPLALLPLPAEGPGPSRAALVWCVNGDDDPVREATDTQRLTMMQSLLPPTAGRLLSVSKLKAFPLGLNAERRLVQQGRIVRIGNAAQTLHPVAGQGLNLGLRDAYELVARLRDGNDVDTALRQLDRARAFDRWSTIAGTDFLARSFAWRAPVLGPLRGLALSALQGVAPLKTLLARQMMFGHR